MKLYDSAKVFAGLVVFVLIFTSPILFNFALGEDMEEIDLGPAREKAQACVEDTEWMKAYHMDLLNDWRDAVVRDGNRIYESKLNGKQYNMSLSNTCMDCHNNYKSFCNRCHTYNEVDPFCWDCHLNFSEEFK